MRVIDYIQYLKTVCEIQFDGILFCDFSPTPKEFTYIKLEELDDCLRRVGGFYDLNNTSDNFSYYLNENVGISADKSYYIPTIEDQKLLEVIGPEPDKKYIVLFVLQLLSPQTDDDWSWLLD